jgi:hypothetical protein
VRVFGLLLLFSGWVLVLTAIVLLAGVPLQAFLLVAVGVELLGATLMMRFHMGPQKSRRP